MWNIPSCIVYIHRSFRERWPSKKTHVATRVTRGSRKVIYPSLCTFTGEWPRLPCINQNNCMLDGRVPNLFDPLLSLNIKPVGISLCTIHQPPWFCAWRWVNYSLFPSLIHNNMNRDMKQIKKENDGKKELGPRATSKQSPRNSWLSFVK